MKHEYTTDNTPYGWSVSCRCGGFSLGFFTSADRAKRAAMNTSHGEVTEGKDVRVKFVETKEVK